MKPINSNLSVLRRSLLIIALVFSAALANATAFAGDVDLDRILQIGGKQLEKELKQLPQELANAIHLELVGDNEDTDSEEDDDDDDDNDDEDDDSDEEDEEDEEDDDD